MGAVATEHRAGVAAEDAPEPQLFEAPGPTLEDRVLAVWDELIATGHATCPVCGGSLHAAGGCDDCGSELSS
jgi:hypothetical protein